MRSKYSRVRFTFGLLALAVGLIAANLALFNWVERTDIQYLFGAYARYVCAYGGFASIILGAMLVNESTLESTETHLNAFNTGSCLMMSSDWGINDREAQFSAVGNVLKQEELHIVPEGLLEEELLERESKNKMTWRHEERRVRGRLRSLFRDTETGKFINKPE